MKNDHDELITLIKDNQQQLNQNYSQLRQRKIKRSKHHIKKLLLNNKIVNSFITITLFTLLLSQIQSNMLKNKITGLKQQLEQQKQQQEQTLNTLGQQNKAQLIKANNPIDPADNCNGLIQSIGHTSICQPI